MARPRRVTQVQRDRAVYDHCVEEAREHLERAEGATVREGRRDLIALGQAWATLATAVASAPVRVDPGELLQHGQRLVSIGAMVTAAKALSAEQRRDLHNELYDALGFVMGAWWAAYGVDPPQL